MNPLIAQIRASGPVSVEEFTALALGHPEHGYYRGRRQVLGRSGDFVTAPEISQMFGELIGLWAVTAWHAMGSPAAFDLIELGPGRGSLMADALRAAKLVPEFARALRLNLVETSETLRQAQRLALQTTASPATWHDVLPQLNSPAIIIANEFLDALPVDQLVYDGGGWRRRQVVAAADAGLEFCLGASVAVPPERLPVTPAKADDIVEIRPAAERLIATLAATAAVRPLAALFIDYGYLGPAYGETLQAISQHRYTDPLAAPGEHDLTAHVDFGALVRLASVADAQSFGPVTQSAFLGELGIGERARCLAAGKSTRVAVEIATAVARLLSPTGMGGRFQAFAIGSPALPQLPGFGTSRR